ncbi:MAG: hypothetical protein KC516_01130 [Nanoarchaeota archaeon]|nr:hypothetical protein [Nanoarchaeota archaeon]
MNWTKRDVFTDLFLIMGMVVIVVGFIHLIGFHPWGIIIAGFIILQIGVIKFFNERKRGKKK